MEVIASRIAGFLKQNPGIQLHLNNLDIDSIAQDREDAQIKYCLHPPAGMYNIELLKEKLVPVCSPSLLANVTNPEDLLVNPDIPRLHYRDVNDWKRWISHHGFDDLTANSNLFLTTNTHCWRLLVPDRALVFLIGLWSKTTCSAEASASCPSDISSPKNPTNLYAATKTLPPTRRCSSSATGLSKRFRPSVRFRQLFQMEEVADSRLSSGSRLRSADADMHLEPLLVCNCKAAATMRGGRLVMLRGFPCRMESASPMPFKPAPASNQNPTMRNQVV